MPSSAPDNDPPGLTRAEFQILLALADRDRHGYGIMQEVLAQTSDQMRMGPGTLYRTLKQLLQRGCIAEADERPDPEQDDERRRYYRLTDAGRGVARAEAQRIEVSVAAARRKKLLARPRTPVRGGGG